MEGKKGCEKEHGEMGKVKQGVGNGDTWGSRKTGRHTESRERRCEEKKEGRCEGKGGREMSLVYWERGGRFGRGCRWEGKA